MKLRFLGNKMRSHRRLGTIFGVAAIVSFCRVSFAETGCFDATVSQWREALAVPDAARRATAAENLGFLRAYGAAKALAGAAGDPVPAVRREASLSLAWCGGREEIPLLIESLADEEWSVRQAAWVALTNLSGREFPFDAHAEAERRGSQAATWWKWWRSLSPSKPSAECLALLAESRNRDLAAGRPVSASTTYKGPAAVLTDGSLGGFWQTKNVPFPQHCTVDLGAAAPVGCVAVSQYGAGFRMTDCGVEISLDGENFREVWREREPTPTHLVVSFPREKARHVRVVSHGSERPLYPATFYRVQVYEDAGQAERELSSYLSRERALRALGCLGGEGAAEAVAAFLDPYRLRGAEGTEEKLMAQAGVRALGRLGGGDAESLLIGLLDAPQWARYAADALGDCGGEAAATALIDAYPSYAVDLNGQPPVRIPRDDKPGFEAVDRMYETPSAIARALDRISFTSESVIEKLRGIVPLLVVNMASDFDGAMLYEEQAYQRVTAALLERSGARREVCEIAWEALGAPGKRTAPPILSEAARKALLERAKAGPGGTSFAAGWLTALCRDEECLPRLSRLLEHENGWVRINAAKTLMFMKAAPAAGEIAAILENSPPEADLGYQGDFFFKQEGHQGHDEYSAPSPRWREAFTRALGAIGGAADVPLLARLLNDERNVLEVRVSAAVSLDRIGGDAAISVLQEAARGHPYHSIRLLAREALWKRGKNWAGPPEKIAEVATANNLRSGVSASDGLPGALVFIRGDHEMPNNFQIDPWRQTYSTTDSGPTYRLGKNLCLLTAAAGGWEARALTDFADGYVADCEVSWDGSRVVFARREQVIPWWHVWEIDLESGAARQLTRGPYHDVQPAFLPDGRIVFSSTRTGMRDEYHGYPATGLTVMNRDGSDIHCIGFNLGRDNEPAILPDGNIVFSRLELFYSRLKTEITVQTARPDGVMNETLYGPERRHYWRRITQESGEKWWGEAPSRHRVLRLTQPQPFGRQQVMVATTGGAAVVGPGRAEERVLPRFQNMAVTSLYPLDEKTALCAATVRAEKQSEIDLGLYTMDTETGELRLLYNDPAAADFEARPIRGREIPPAFPDTIDRDAYTAQLFCKSARTSQEALTRDRGRLVRIIEGQPVTGRHHTHNSSAGPAWKNHTGTLARILGTVPLAADGSFFVEVPADRLIHFQVLDSDRRVVGNQLIWMYARPGETRGCVGCHEMPDSTPAMHQALPLSTEYPAIPCLPTGDEFSYRAKVWQKGELGDEAEERTRTVNAINLPGRM